MPQPTVNDLHVVAALTNVSVAYIQDQSNFISMNIAPMVPVQFKSDKYHVFNSPDFRRNTAKPRAAGKESAGTGFNVSQETYTCEVYALHEDVSEQARANTDPGIDLDRAASILVTQQMMIQKETQWATDFWTTGIWGTDVVGGTDFVVWSDGASDPEKDIADGRVAMVKRTGMMPNTLVVSMGTHEALKRHPLIKDNFKYTSSASITTAMLAAYFEVDRYMVARASYTTSAELAATETNAFILGNNALLAYVASTPGIMVPSAMYTFVWSGFLGSASGFRIATIPAPLLRSDRVEGEWAYDHKVVSAPCGYFFSGTV